MKLLKMVGKILFDPPNSAIILYRISRKIKRKNYRYSSALSKFIRRINLTLNNVDISPLAELGYNFIIAHCVGVVIGDCKTGANVTVFQNVTIGVRNIIKNTPSTAATIGDNVTICSGAVVLGTIKIGNNVVIGANSVVLQDIPDNCTAIGVPARIIHNKS